MWSKKWNACDKPNRLKMWQTDLTRNVNKKLKRMWWTDSTQNEIKKVKHTFPGASYPYTLREMIQINGRQMAQIEKFQHLDYLNLSLYTLVPTTEGQPSFRVTPIDQDGYQYALLLLSGILNLLKLVGIVNNKDELFSLWDYVRPGEFRRPKVKQYEVNSVYI